MSDVTKQPPEATVAPPPADAATVEGAPVAHVSVTRRVPAPPRRERFGVRRLLGILGPGLVTGAADDDPSGIATYTQTGAQFGYGQLWTALWMLPLVTAVQEACGRIGYVTHKGLAGVIRDHYSHRVLRAVVLLVVVANVINIGADIGAVAAAAGLVVPLSASLLAVVFTAVVLTAEIRFSYRQYSKVLKWLTISLLAYPVASFLVAEPWGDIARATFVPHFELSASFFYVITAVIGTTISPYMFFWQASQEVEEDRAQGKRRSLRDLRIDNAAGMFFSQATTWFIIVLAGTTLHNAGITKVNSAADAAKALRPLVHGFPHSGDIAQGLFALGIVSLGMLAVPVLAGSASYAASEARGWKEGLDLAPSQGRQFYGVIAGAMLIGLGLNLFGANPIAALVFAAAFNGVAAVPLLWIIGRIAADQRVMGAARSGWLSRVTIGATFAGMAGSVLLAVVALAHR
jgi:NRAMP (natural resistance-associated macrophage protein)-like metal ion transporter